MLDRSLLARRLGDYIGEGVAVGECGASGWADNVIACQIRRDAAFRHGVNCLAFGLNRPEVDGEVDLLQVGNTNVLVQVAGDPKNFSRVHHWNRVHRRCVGVLHQGIAIVWAAPN